MVTSIVTVAECGSAEYLCAMQPRRTKQRKAEVIPSVPIIRTMCLVANVSFLKLNEAEN